MSKLRRFLVGVGSPWQRQRNAGCVKKCIMYIVGRFWGFGWDGSLGVTRGFWFFLVRFHFFDVGFWDRTLLDSLEEGRVSDNALCGTLSSDLGTVFPNHDQGIRVVGGSDLIPFCLLDQDKITVGDGRGGRVTSAISV